MDRMSKGAKVGIIALMAADEGEGGRVKVLDEWRFSCRCRRRIVGGNSAHLC